MTADAPRALRAPLASHADGLERVELVTSGAVSAREITGPSQVALRVEPAHASASPVAVPIEPNTWIGDGTEALWLGPDEWLLVTQREARDVIGTIHAALGTHHHAAVDVSANRAIVELSGPARHDLLASRCPIDLHPRSWERGRCAQTLFGRAPVLLQHRGDATRLFVRPSFGGYVVDLVLDAAAMRRTS